MEEKFDVSEQGALFAAQKVTSPEKTDLHEANSPLFAEGIKGDLSDSENPNKKDTESKKPPISRIIGQFVTLSGAPIIAVLFIIIYTAYFKIYPFGRRMMSSYDLLAQIVPFAEHLFDVLEGRASLFYSFSIAGGADVFGTIAYCLVSPFTFIFLLGGKGMAVYMTPFVLMAKVACISLSSTFFIKTNFKNIPVPLVISIALLYTYSGYFFVANTYINWLDFLIYMPLVMHTFKRMVKTGKCFLFSLSMAANIYTCFSIACFSMLITFPIFIIYALFCAEKEGKKQLITKICLSHVLTVGLALPMIFPAFMAYLRSGRNTGLFSELGNKLDAEHLYRKLSYVVYDTVFLICGIYYFITCNKKAGLNKFLFVSAIIVFAPVLVDEICLILNAGSYMSYALRFGFLNSALGMYLTCKALDRKTDETNPVKKTKWPISCIIGIILLAAAAFSMYVSEDIADKGKNSFFFSLAPFSEGTLIYGIYEAADFGASFSSAFAHSLGGLEVIAPLALVIAIGVVAVLILKKVRLMPQIVSIVIISALSAIQVAFGSLHGVAGNNNSMITYDQIQVVLNDISARENGDFASYRIKDYNNKVTADAPLTLHYRAYSVFSSVIDRDNFIPMDFFKYTGNGINTIKTRGGNVFSDALLGYKYAYVHNSGSTGSIYSNAWSLIGEHSPFYLFENDCVLPTAFTIPATEYSFAGGDYADKLDRLYLWLGGEGELTDKTYPKITYYDDGDYYKLVFTASSIVPGNSYLLAALPEGLSAKYCQSTMFADEDAKEITDDLRIDVGYSKNRASKTICVKFTEGNVTEEIISKSFKMATISYKKVKDLAEGAKLRAADVKFGKKTISAEVNGNGENYLFVNYMAIDGYTCKINGNPVKLTKNDMGFLAVRLEEGENKVVFTYRSPYVKYIVLGALAGGMLAALSILAFKFYDRLKKFIELTATVLASALVLFIGGLGFVYPFVLFIIKCIKAVF